MQPKIRVVHYLNQFFAGVGGEDKANQTVCVKEGPVGPGRLLQQILGDEGEVVRTVYCGDDYFVAHTEESVQEILRTVQEIGPDVFVAGPAFNAGRYGTACAVLSRRVKSDLRIPALTGMYRENPGVEMCRAVVPVIPTSEAGSQMQDALARLARLVSKLGRGEALGRPDEEGYLPHGQRLNQRHDKSGAERAIAMLLQKVKGREYTSEIPVPDFGDIVPAPPLSSIAGKKFALVTVGGVVPQGNPDKIESRRASHWGKYSVAGMDGLSPKDWTCVHGGFDNKYIHEDPNRVVPLDALREMEREGVIGPIHAYLYSTVGAGAPVARARTFGQEIAADLKAAGVDAVVFTST